MPSFTSDSPSAKSTEAEAKRTFEVLKEMSQLDELEWIEEVADKSLQPFEEKAL